MLTASLLVFDMLFIETCACQNNVLNADSNVQLTF